MEETKRELVREGEGRPELVVGRQGSVRVVANAVGGGKPNRTGDFPGKKLPDWREYSNRCPKRRREWLVGMEERYGSVGDYAVASVNRDEREGFSEKLEPIPIVKRPARYRRYCLARFVGRKLDDGSSDSSSGDDMIFKSASMKRKKEETDNKMKEKTEDNAENSRNRTAFERDGESGSGSSSSKSSGKSKMHNFLNKFSFKRSAAPDHSPPPIPADAKEKKGESSQQPSSRSGQTQSHEIKEKFHGTNRANTIHRSRSSGQVRCGLSSGRKEDQQQVGLSLNDFSTTSQRKTHGSSYNKTKMYTSTCTQSSFGENCNDSSRSPSKASSSKPPVVHNPSSHIRPQPLAPMPSDVCKILKQVDHDNKGVESYVPLIASPLLPTPSPSPPKHREEVREPRDLSNKGKQKLDELRTACEARLDKVAQDAAERTREVIRREREVIENENENEKERQERKERLDSGAEVKTGMERESKLKQEELTSSAHQNKGGKVLSKSPSSSKTQAENSAPKDTNTRTRNSPNTVTRSENSQPSTSTSEPTQTNYQSNKTHKDPVPLLTPPTSPPFTLRHKSNLPIRTRTKIPLPSSPNNSPRTHSPLSYPPERVHPLTVHSRSSSLPTPSNAYLTKDQRAPTTPMNDKRKTAPGSLGVSVPREVERTEEQAKGSLRRSSRAVWRYQVERAGDASRKRRSGGDA
jgi:hypothetical protein